MQKNAYILAPAILLTGLASLALLSRAFAPRGGAISPSSTTNVLSNAPGMADRLVVIDSPVGWRLGSAEHVILSEHGIRLVNGRRRGQWISPVCTTDFPFTELLPSWNAAVPQNSAIRADLRARDAGAGAWSPWLYVGSWGDASDFEPRPTSYSGGVVHTDVLVLHRPADAFQLRLTLLSRPDARTSPDLRRLSVAYSGIGNLPFESSTSTGWQNVPHPPPTHREAHDLPIPFRTQQHAPPHLRGEICSPTSVSMVLEYFGINRPTVENAQAIYDPDAQIYGNWNRAVQFCAQHGLRGHLTRFRNWTDVKAQLAIGQPIIASIKFAKGEFPSSVLANGTAGHLLVIRGFTADGRIIVNDPASAARGDAAIYDAADFARAWFGNGGVAYVIHP